MNSQELRQYKRDKSKKFNAHLRDLRLKDKENQLFQKVESKVEPNQIQPDNLQDDNLTIQDVMDIFSTLDTKLDLIQTKLENKLENKIDELFNRLDTIESIIETKLETKLETKQPQPNSIFFA